MMRPWMAIPLVAIGLPLSGCSLFDDPDWREGVEEVNACIDRVRSQHHDGVLELLDDAEQRQPTYTFDVTKMNLADIDAITVPESEGQSGSVQVSGFKAPAYIIHDFMEMSVDEKGAFMLGRDPSIYRVRGEPIALKDVFAKGCERQKPGMRLISFTFSKTPASETGGPHTDTESETTE